jgi:hypothetical protein
MIELLRAVQFESEDESWPLTACYTRPCHDESAFPFRSLASVGSCGFALYRSRIYALSANLTTDGFYYLSFADAEARGDGLNALYRRHFLLPKGYPAFLFILMKAGALSSSKLVASNLILFSFGLLLNFQTLISLGYERKCDPGDDAGQGTSRQ